MQYIFAHRNLVEYMRHDDLHISQLTGNSYNAHRCGYVTPSGTYFTCQPYNHVDLLRSFAEGSYKELFDAFMERYTALDHHGDVSHSIYDTFFMVELEWVKVAAYMESTPENSQPGPMNTKTFNWTVERFFDLTPAQTEAIYQH